MRRDFCEKVLTDLLNCGLVDRDDRVLAVCAGSADQQLLADLGFREAVLTNLDTDTGVRPHSGERIAADWQQADVHDLPYNDDSFDVSIVCDGLHHCRSPHRAVSEMYRVAARTTIVIESRDSAAMRLAGRVGLVGDFELNGRLLETREHGGVDFGPIPNYVFRWTEREFEKTLTSLDPSHVREYRYYHGLNLPAGLRRNPLASAASRLLTQVMPRQANTFAAVAVKRGLPSYLAETPVGVRLRDEITTPTVLRFSPNRTRVRC